MGYVRSSGRVVCSRRGEEKERAAGERGGRHGVEREERAQEEEERGDQGPSCRALQMTHADRYTGGGLLSCSPGAPLSGELLARCGAELSTASPRLHPTHPAGGECWRPSALKQGVLSDPPTTPFTVRPPPPSRSFPYSSSPVSLLPYGDSHFPDIPSTPLPLLFTSSHISPRPSPPPPCPPFPTVQGLATLT